jgi:hypothetical protein
MDSISRLIGVSDEEPVVCESDLSSIESGESVCNELHINPGKKLMA